MISSYFKIEEKLNNASKFAAWRAKLDVTLEENDVMKYVQGKVVETPKNANAMSNTSKRRVISRLRISSLILSDIISSLMCPS